MRRVFFVVTAYILALVLTGGLAVACFMLANEWRSWSDQLTYASLAMGVLLTTCALLIAFVAMFRLTSVTNGDES